MSLSAASKRKREEEANEATAAKRPRLTNIPTPFEKPYLQPSYAGFNGIYVTITENKDISTHLELYKEGKKQVQDTPNIYYEQSPNSLTFYQICATPMDPHKELAQVLAVCEKKKSQLDLLTRQIHSGQKEQKENVLQQIQHILRTLPPQAAIDYFKVLIKDGYDNPTHNLDYSLVAMYKVKINRNSINIRFPAFLGDEDTSSSYTDTFKEIIKSETPKLRSNFKNSTVKRHAPSTSLVHNLTREQRAPAQKPRVVKQQQQRPVPALAPSARQSEENQDLALALALALAESEKEAEALDYFAPPPEFKFVAIPGDGWCFYHCLRLGLRAAREGLDDIAVESDRGTLDVLGLLTAIQIKDWVFGHRDTLVKINENAENTTLENYYTTYSMQNVNVTVFNTNIQTQRFNFEEYFNQTVQTTTSGGAKIYPETNITALAAAYAFQTNIIIHHPRQGLNIFPPDATHTIHIIQTTVNHYNLLLPQKLTKLVKDYHNQYPLLGDFMDTDYTANYNPVRNFFTNDENLGSTPAQILAKHPRHENTLLREALQILRVKVAAKAAAAPEAAEATDRPSLPLEPKPRISLKLKRKAPEQKQEDEPIGKQPKTTHITLKKLHEISGKNTAQFKAIAADPQVMQFIADGKVWNSGKVDDVIRYAGEDWASIEQAAASLHWAIMSDDTLVGYIAIILQKDKKDGKSYELRYFVAADQQGKGIGSRALALAMEEFKEFKELRHDGPGPGPGPAIYASVHTDNANGIKFLEKNGFKQVRRDSKGGKNLLVYQAAF